jgi:hypothetical protein
MVGMDRIDCLNFIILVLMGGRVGFSDGSHSHRLGSLVVLLNDFEVQGSLIHGLEVGMISLQR